MENKVEESIKKEMKYNMSDKREKILKLIIVISCSILTIVWSTRFQIKHTLIGALASLFVSALIMFETDIRITQIYKKNCCISSILSCYMMKVFLSFYNCTIQTLSENLNISIDVIKAFLGILALPALTFIVYKFIELVIPRVKKFITTLTKAEKEYIQIIFIISVILTFFTIHMTDAFCRPNDIDVIYTTDSKDLLIKDVYCNVSHNENDLRQPLFGIFALPFGILARLISEFVFFVPSEYSYEAVMTVFQFLIITITTILIARLMKIEEKDKKYLYMLFSLSFPYIIFNLVLEQYAISVFYLILTIYCFCNNDGVNYTYICATGTLLTSGILFPLITKYKNLKQCIKDIIISASVFFAIIIIGGQFTQIVTVKYTLTTLLRFAKPLPLIDKIYQF